MSVLSANDTVIALLLDAFKTSVAYLQIVSMHEIINTFYQPPGSDKAYARLMCWGLFFGQTVDGEHSQCFEAAQLMLPRSVPGLVPMVGSHTRSQIARSL